MDQPIKWILQLHIQRNIWIPCPKNAGKMHKLGPLSCYYILPNRVGVGRIEKTLVSGGSSQRPDASARLKP
jgi:hypothetical protein